jgi:hypothetical protein
VQTKNPAQTPLIRTRLGELGLPNAGRPEEQERRAAAARGEARARAEDRVGDRHDGRVLADDAPVELVAELEQLLALRGEELGDGDASPAAHDLRVSFRERW